MVIFMLLVLLFLFLIGLFIGSFLNVLIDRLPRGETILGRSHCENCHRTLRWYDLLPLVSFAFTRGKCRYCHTRLSYQYPFMELFTGVSFVLVLLFTLNNSVSFGGNFMVIILFNLSVVSSLIVIFFADLKYKIIPDEVLIFLGVVTFLWLIFTSPDLFFQNLLTGLGAFLFFLFIFLLTRGRGMGFGDVKFAFLIGLLLGFPQAPIALYVAFLTGGLVGIILILWKKKGMKSEVPFGPFLVFGTVISFFFSPFIIPVIAGLLS